MYQILIVLGGFGVLSASHGDHAHQKPLEVDPNADWVTRHMAEEHHISLFDSLSFFTMHDVNNDGFWDSDEILTFYGMKDVSAVSIPPAKKMSISDTVLKLIDKTGDDRISKLEWLQFAGNEWGKAGVLPDFGTGPGHHGDDEYEYETHHWEKYHDENTKEEDLIHDEDIEHFKMHDRLEEARERLEKMDHMSIVEENIPAMFRRMKP